MKRSVLLCISQSCVSQQVFLMTDHRVKRYPESSYDIKNGEIKEDEQERDIVDREDHVTQYLADQMVNTDSEITSLQASEVEEDRGDVIQEDAFTSYVVEQSESQETLLRPKRQELLAVISLFALGVAELPAPYPASGWRPSGPAFDLPQRVPAQPQVQEYLPPVDPRNKPSNEYGVPEEDVSVQGLPGRGDQQIFQQSPINGQPVSGPGLNTDIRNLDQGLNQNQYQQQQEIYQQFLRQKQFEASQINKEFDRLPRPEPPRKFAQSPRTTQQPTTTETPFTQATEPNLNERELLEDSEPVSAKQKKSKKVSVEISRQNIQEYPGELFLSSLAQLQLQPQFVPLQQVRSQVVLQQSREQKEGFDGPTHFAALPSVLTQQQLQNQYQNPGLLVASQPANPELFVQPPVSQYQPLNYQPAQEQQNFIPQSNPDAETVTVQQPVPRYQPVNYQPQAFPQLQPQPAVLQPQPQYQPVAVQPQYQPVQLQPQPELQPVALQPQPQLQPVALQPQPVSLQPQGQYQPTLQRQPQQPKQFAQKPDREELDEGYNQSQQPQLYQQPLQPIQYQPNQNLFPAQLIVPDLNQYNQQQYLQPQFIQPSFQGQDQLQSGLDVNQEGNDIDQTEDKEEEDEGPRATAVATAFGTRTQPRVFNQYGPPFPVPKVQAQPEATTTDSPVEEVTEDGPAFAQAIAVANPSRRKSARLRNRRLRPVVAVDRSGRLVYAEQ
ncbi:hypothetical protein K1T71_013933 [Dendrolimus kikuchii]|uniref:Uncharacterized protein n=1 Tax=Dendrolimus kikuchii TaxID=765133 RepID=A0ACC1CGF6_9NEOP|nr:hypothetical protein K1T71_013933 [Dendrolimus kikuchii]